jgi:biotin transport system substrate-specific component
MERFLMTTHATSLGQKRTYGTQAIILKAAFSLIFAVLMAVSANAFIYLPFTPVPITLQVLTVIFSAIMLGRKWAIASQFTYICMGLAGMPVFAGFMSGPAALIGPTGGYIMGFVLAAYITGTLASGRYFNTRIKKNRYLPALIAGFSGLLVIYLLGGIHLTGFLYSLSQGRPITDIIRSAWIMGIRPFIIIDAAKILAAIIILKPGIKGYEDNKNQ